MSKSPRLFKRYDMEKKIELEALERAVRAIRNLNQWAEDKQGSYHFSVSNWGDGNRNPKISCEVLSAKSRVNVRHTVVFYWDYVHSLSQSSWCLYQPGDTKLKLRGYSDISRLFEAYLKSVWEVHSGYLEDILAIIDPASLTPNGSRGA